MFKKKFKEGLPSKAKFYNSLTNCAISDKTYKHVLNISETFNMNNMKEFSDLYLRVDVLLLAGCMFETFGKISINSFELDLALYLSTPYCTMQY